MPYSLHFVTDAESVLGMGGRTDSNQEFARYLPQCSLNPKNVPLIGVASLVKRASQSDSRLNSHYATSPLNLLV